MSDLAVYAAIRDYFADEEGLSAAQAARAYSDQKLAMMEEVDNMLFQEYANKAANWLEAKMEQAQ